MSQSQVFTGLQKVGDGGWNYQRGMKSGAAAVGTVNGQFFEASSRGTVFTASTVIAGVVIPVAAATLNSKFTFWNPASSGKIAEIISVYIGGDGATTVVNNHGFLLQRNLTSGAGIPTTVTTPCSATSMGNPNGVSAMTVAAQATLTNVAIPGAGGAAVPIPFIPMGNYGAVTSVSFYDPTHYFNGSLIVYPDSLIAACCSVANSTAAVVQITWCECDV